MKNIIFTYIKNKLNLNSDSSELYRIRIEVYIFLCLWFLFDKNWNTLPADDQSEIKKKLIKPSIWTLIEIIRILDTDDIFNNIMKIINLYPNIRNQYVGHWYDIWINDDYLMELKKLWNAIEKYYESSNNLIFKHQDDPFSKNLLFVVTNNSVNHWKYTWYSINYEQILNKWECPSKVRDFEPGSQYIGYDTNKYFKISPFIYIENEWSNIFIFSKVDDPLSGRISFSWIRWSEIKKSINYKWLTKLLNVEDDRWREKSSTNATIKNKYNEEIWRYIEIWSTQIQAQLKEFIRNESWNLAILWWHGGLWKTTQVQKFCHNIFWDNKKNFDYIIFLSAKDRKFNYLTSKIDEISWNITSFDEIIRTVNKVIFSEDSNDPKILNGKNIKLLLIIDDFETFADEEKEKIIRYIEKDLNAIDHKVIITTRNVDLIDNWKKIEIQELWLDETNIFLINSIDSEKWTYNPLTDRIKNLSIEDQKNIHKITFDGKPIAILQLSNVILQNPEILNTLKSVNLNWNDLSNFLYWRIFDQLKFSKKIFLGLWVILKDNDLSVKKDDLLSLTWIESSDFNKGLNELIKLKIIYQEGEFISLYSREILKYIKDRSNEPIFIEMNSKLQNNLLEQPKFEDYLIKAKELYYINPKEALSYYERIIKNYKIPINLRKNWIIWFINCYTQVIEWKIEKISWLLDESISDFKNDAWFLVYISKIFFDTEDNNLQIKSIKILELSLESTKDVNYFLVLVNLTIMKSKVLIKEKRELKRKMNEVFDPEFGKQKFENKLKMQKVLNTIGNEAFLLLSNDDNKDYLIERGWDLLYFSLIKYLTELSMRTTNPALSNKFIKYWENNFEERFQNYFLQQREYLLENNF